MIRYEAADAVVVVTIDRPDRRNALDIATQRALKSAFERFEDDDEARALVLTGAGGTAFCAGADLTELADGVVPDPEAFPVLGRNVEVTKPVVAAVNGVAYGGGFLLAQQCDLAVASATARFGITEARWGRGAPYAALLPRLVPPRVAMELLLTAEPIGAARAFQVGLVNRVVAPDRVVGTAVAMAATIAANAPLSVRAAKAMVHEALGVDAARLHATAEELHRAVYASADAQEGPQAFRERRRPRWTGHTAGSAPSVESPAPRR